MSGIYHHWITKLQPKRAPPDYLVGWPRCVISHITVRFFDPTNMSSNGHWNIFLLHIRTLQKNINVNSFRCCSTCFLKIKKNCSTNKTLRENTKHRNHVGTKLLVSAWLHNGCSCLQWWTTVFNSVHWNKNPLSQFNLWGKTQTGCH